MPLPLITSQGKLQIKFYYYIDIRYYYIDTRIVVDEEP